MVIQATGARRAARARSLAIEPNVIQSIIRSSCNLARLNVVMSRLLPLVRSAMCWARFGPHLNHMMRLLSTVMTDNEDDFDEDGKC